MHPHDTPESYELVSDELHFQLLAKNAFRATLVGAVLFCVACAYVFVH